MFVVADNISNKLVTKTPNFLIQVLTSTRLVYPRCEATFGIDKQQSSAGLAGGGEVWSDSLTQ